MIGVKSILSSILAKALSSVLEVDPREIETNLLSSEDKRLVLQKAKLKQRRIRVSRRADGVATFLVLKGTLEEFSISWSWSSSRRIVEKSLLVATGVHLEAHFEFETLEPIKEEDAKKPSFFKELWQDTFHRIKTSEQFRQTITDFFDTLSVRIRDVRFRLNLPRKDHTSSLYASLKALDFQAEGNYAESGPHNMSVEQSLNFNTRLDCLSLQAFDDHVEVPILESLSYAATIRKVSGKRFNPAESGFEFIGRERQSRENANANNSNEGIVLHLSKATVPVLATTISLFRGQGEIEPETDKESSHHRGSRGLHPVRTSEEKKHMVRFVVLFILASLAAFSVLAKSGVTLSNDSTIWLGTSAAALISLVWLLVQRFKEKILSNARSRPRLPTSRRHAAVFRIPVPFVTVVGPMGASATLSKVSILGRLNFKVINMAAEGLILSGGAPESMPVRATATGIRSSVKNGVILLNIDSISELYHPQRFKLLQPVMYTVVRFEKGVLTTKWKTVDVQILSEVTSTKDDESLDPLTEIGLRIGSFVGDARQRVRDTTQKLNEGLNWGVTSGMQGIGDLTGLRTASPVLEPTPAAHEIARARINSELFSRVVTLKSVAEMLLSIPLSKNRFRLRKYPNTFRGNEAVNYLLDCKVAQDRVEAGKLLRDIQITFSLFEHVTKECNFRDDHDAVFRFVDETKRRMWDLDSVPFKYTEISDEEAEHAFLPFPIKIFTEGVIWRKPNEKEPFLSHRGAEIFVEPAKLAHADVVNAFFVSLETSMLNVENARIRAVFDPDLPHEIHGLEMSVDSLQASPEQTTDDWYEKLGFVRQGDSASEKPKERSSTPFTPFSLPFMYIAPFKLHLSWKGIIISTKETSVGIEAFSGDETSTSNDLISHFVMHVLSRAPGLLANFRILGVNVMEKSGIVTALTVGAKFAPFGEFLGLAGMALFDGVTAALDNGKAARNDPNGSYKPGDVFRGLIYGAQEAARTGAHTRGKGSGNLYDEEDEVTLDPLDFAIGASSGTAKYIYTNKARFAGAAIAGGSVVALTVATGPVFGIILGVACGVAAEKVIKRAEDKFEKRTSKEVEDDLLGDSSPSEK